MRKEQGNGPLAGLGTTQLAVIRHVRRRGSTARADIAESFGITPAAVSMVTRELIDRGILVEGEWRKGVRGAPHVDLTLSKSIGYAVGVHASRHSLVLTLLDFSGQIVGERQLPGAYERFEDVRQAILDTVPLLLDGAEAGPAMLVGTGIALPTRFHRNQDHLDLADEVLSWAGSDLSSSIEAALRCPVIFENDANAAAIGELSLGNSAGYGNFAYLYLSEGIGSGLIINSQLYRGGSGNAGEIGGLRMRGLSRPSFNDLVLWCQERNQNTPAGRDPDIWAAFLAAHPALLDSWIDRAGPELAELGYALAAIMAPDALYLGGTLPASVRKRLAVWLDFAHSKPDQKARVTQPGILLPDVTATDVVAFGAAAMVLHGQWALRSEPDSRQRAPLR